MDRLKQLIEKRIEVGKRPWNGDKESMRNRIELHEIDTKIVTRVLELYKQGELYQAGQSCSTERRRDGRGQGKDTH